MKRPKVIQNSLLPPRKFDAITLFGFIFTRRGHTMSQRMLRHELIHCRQQREWLYIPFFILYAIEWLIYYIMYRDSDRAYRAISFEREAYMHDSDPDYLSKRRPYANYRRTG